MCRFQPLCVLVFKTEQIGVFKRKRQPLGLPDNTRIGAAFAACLLVASSLVLLVRFVFKDGVLALVYAPVFLFNAYCLAVMCFLALNN